MANNDYSGLYQKVLGRGTECLDKSRLVIPLMNTTKEVNMECQ